MYVTLVPSDLSLVAMENPVKIKNCIERLTDKLFSFPRLTRQQAKRRKITVPQFDLSGNPILDAPPGTCGQSIAMISENLIIEDVDVDVANIAHERHCDQEGSDSKNVDPTVDELLQGIIDIGPQPEESLPPPLVDGVTAPVHFKEPSVGEKRKVAWQDSMPSNSSWEDLGAPEKRHHKKKLKTAASVLENADVYQAESDIRMPVTKGFWRGKQASGHLSAKDLAELIESHQLGPDALRPLLRHLRPVPFVFDGRRTSKRSTFIQDRYRRLFIVRPFLTQNMIDLERAVRKEALLCAAEWTDDPNDIEKNHRGRHSFCNMGHDRQNKETPQLTSWHRRHPWLMEKYFSEGKPLWRLVKLVNELLWLYFPVIAQRYEDCAKKIKKEYDLEPFFGLFWNFCINAPRPGIPRVHCWPHVDSMNIALGVCCVYVYGIFDHCEKAWLVIWEIDRVIELPAGVLLFYPSSIFFHFNVDRIDFAEIVVTDVHVEKPTKSNSRSLNVSQEHWENGHGRGSIVLFNQATMFQTAELGVSTIKEAKKRGMTTVCDGMDWLRRGVFPQGN